MGRVTKVSDPLREIIVKCSEGRGRSCWVCQLIQTNWKPSGGSKEPTGVGWVALVGRVCLCSSVCRVNKMMAHSWCSVTHVWNEWIPVKGDGTVVSYQRFATLNDIALSNQVVQNLGLWEISSRGTLDTVHPMLGEGTVGWPSSQSQKSWDRGVLLMCVGGPGDHTSSGWSSSSTELCRSHMPRAWLVKWLQPIGSPRRQTRNRDL